MFLQCLFWLLYQNINNKSHILFIKNISLKANICRQAFRCNLLGYILLNFNVIKKHAVLFSPAYCRGFNCTLKASGKMYNKRFLCYILCDLLLTVVQLFPSASGYDLSLSLTFAPFSSIVDAEFPQNHSMLSYAILFSVITAP